MTSQKSDASLPPLVVGIGGTIKPFSSTEQALDIALAEAEKAGARTVKFGGEFLSQLPHYLVGGAVEDSEAVRSFIAAIREAKGVIIASPGYHGSVSGLVKNAIDYTEEMSKDERVYLDGVPVGLISTAYGWQATASTMAALRSIVHALRGWPTPLGAGINSSGGMFKDGQCHDEGVSRQLAMVGQQVVEFALKR